MQETVDRRTCDRCGKVKEQAGPMIGGSPFHGWLHVERTNGSLAPHRPERLLDFCCDECCIVFLSARANTKDDRP